jgi:hypothetical protein
MTPTVELRTRLRKLLSEVIPPDENDVDTRFLNTEIDQFLSDADNLYRAASRGWTVKAGLIQAELGTVEQYTIGQETYKTVNLQTALRSALEMADRYAALAGPLPATGSMILGVNPPEVL